MGESTEHLSSTVRNTYSTQPLRLPTPNIHLQSTNIKLSSSPHISHHRCLVPRLLSRDRVIIHDRLHCSSPPHVDRSDTMESQHHLSHPLYKKTTIPAAFSGKRGPTLFRHPQVRRLFKVRSATVGRIYTSADVSCPASSISKVRTFYSLRCLGLTVGDRGLAIWGLKMSGDGCVLD